MLQVDGITTHYGRIRAVHEVSLEVAEGEIVTLIGGNGAGKSTTLMTISGVLKPTAGEVRFYGRAIQGQPAYKVARAGIVQVPEGRRVLPALSVQENLDMGGFALKAEVRAERMARVYDLFPRLRERLRQQAGTLSGGEQQMLAMGRAIMAKPRILLLDEPSLGLAPKIVEQIFAIIVDLNAAGTTILLVEQNAGMALEIAHRGYVLETGSLVSRGTAAELRADPGVRRAYLGL